MEVVELKEKGFWANMYMLVFTELPDNTCIYKRNLVLALLLNLVALPITLVRYALRVSIKNEAHYFRVSGFGPTLVAIIIAAGSYTMGYFYIDDTDPYTLILVLYGFLTLMGAILSVGAFAFGIGAMADYFADRKFKKSLEPAKPDGTIKTLYKGFVEKYCNKIEWYN